MNQSLSLSDDLVRQIEERVETGAYASADAVVREALALLEQHHRAEADKLAWLQESWLAGVASEDVGEFDRTRFDGVVRRRLSHGG